MKKPPYYRNHKHVLSRLRLLGYRITPSTKQDRIKAYKGLERYAGLRSDGRGREEALAELGLGR